jgi:hypothetical protein
MPPASVGGNRPPGIARLVQADEDTVRDVIHRFDEIGLACPDPLRGQHACLRRRDANARHRDVLAAERKGTRPHPKREGHPLGRTSSQHRGLIQVGEPIGGSAGRRRLGAIGAAP